MERRAANHTDPSAADSRPVRRRLLAITIGVGVVLGACTSAATQQALTTQADIPKPTFRPPKLTLPLPAITADVGTAQADPTASPTATASPTTTTVPGSTAAGTEAPTTTTSSSTTTTTTTLVLVTNGAIVLVANASNIDGGAARMGMLLSSRGFKTKRPTTAAGVEAKLEQSKIYLKPGMEAQARSLSALLGGIPLAYMPTPISIKGGPVNLGDANIVLMLGSDLADKKI